MKPFFGVHEKPSELFEKAPLILKEKPDVGDAVLQHGDPFQAKAEGKTRNLFRIIPYIFENLGVDHTRSQDFQPAALPADATAAPVAHNALNIDLRTGFCERKEAGAEPDGRLLARLF